MKNCVNCGAEISDDAKFCGKCGEKQERPTKHCIHCGAEIPGDFVYCEVCGTKQNTNDQPAPMTAKVPEPPVMSAQVVHEPSLRQKLMPYTVFTIIVQLAIIVLMFFDFGVISVKYDLEDINGLLVLIQGDYSINVFDLLDFSDTLGEICPFRNQASLQNIIEDCQGLACLFLIPLGFTLVLYLFFIMANRVRPSKYSSACLLMPACFSFFSILITYNLPSKITNYSVDLAKFFGWYPSWQSIVIIVLTVAQLIANFVVGNIDTHTNSVGIVAKINLKLEKTGCIIPTILLVALVIALVALALDNPLIAIFGILGDLTIGGALILKCFLSKTKQSRKWICECGCENKEYYVFCHGCGKRR